mmetsp:Transcript_21391/g.46448  ORF Transcript_21391/g.46448 Transcript_21391/m.46448 type:complete len:277 (-) Transcript_21391:196-1026(-)|eukprot:CAMPEP_0172312022 /NCGR_PEP_ID=MMETSP1058-20130122/16426_1 /TAXON_ID=83371 /ORGANISM="Detonula confervacea, Strain CCMP 353" /LENGTH=276 /DNA_ID=CAMNT_0013025363 /DNA_START=44 /DNA_END=874 /DNA_ORIENTATION=-
MRKLGNACHAISSASILAYTAATFSFAKPGSAFFDEEWVKHGFCVIQQDIPYWNSHDLCLYFDVILVTVGLLVYGSLRGMPTPEMKYADEMMLFNLLGHLGHGVAHGFIGATFRSGDYVGAQHITGMEQLLAMKEDQMKILTHVCIGIFFWVGLLKGVVPKVSTGKVSISAVVVYIGGLFVTDVLGFAYVQAVIAVAFASTQLMLPREEKHFAYAAFALISVPLSIIPWVESTACQDFASKFGGHLIYDMAIPTLLTAAYYFSWRHYSVQKKDKQA